MIRLFRDSGRFYRNSDEMFALTSWVQVMIGQRIIPRGLSSDGGPRRGRRSSTDSDDSVRGVIASCVAAMPEHEAFIERCCKAPAAA